MILIFAAALALGSGPVETRLDAEPGFSGAAWVFDTDTVLEATATDPAMLEGDWRWASVSKLVNAVAVLQGVDDGLFSLDTEVREILEAPEQPGLTVRDLLRHTTGLINPEGAEALARVREMGPDAFCRQEPAGSPGGAFAYNNCDTVIAAQVLSVARGEFYETILQTGVFDPAGLSRTRSGRGADNGDFDGTLSSGSPAPQFDLGLWGASGDLVGPGGDLVAFAQALMRGALLSEESMTALRTGDPALGYVSLGAWSFPASLAGCEGSVSLLERRGHILGVQGRLILAPDLGRGLVVFTDRNVQDFGEIWIGRGLSFDLASAVFCTSPG